MDNFKIINAQQVIDASEELLQFFTKLNGIADNLESDKNRIIDSWASETEDKNSYVAGLQKNITNLRALARGIRECANTSMVYAQRALEASRNQIN